MSNLLNRSKAFKIVVAHEAGGVGKTTTTINLGYELALLGLRICLFDLDTHYDLSRRLGLKPSAPTLAAALESGKLTPSRQTCTWNGVSLDVVAGDEEIATAEAALTAVMQAREKRLQLIVRPLLDQYDVLIFDCPASKSLLTVNALNAADGVIIPVQSQDKAYNAISLINATIDEVAQYTDLQILGYLVTMAAPTRAEQEIAEAIHADYPQLAFTTNIPRRVELTVEARYQAPVGSYMPKGDAATAYRAVAAQVVERIQHWESNHA